MKKILILALVTLVIFSSGCISGFELPFGQKQETQVSYGVVVNSFEPDFPEVESGDTAEIYMEIENNGGSKAADVYAYLYNLGDLQAEVRDHMFGDLEPPDESVNLPGDVDTFTWKITTPELPQGVSQVYTPKVRLMYKYYTIATKTIRLLTKDEYRRLREKNQVPGGAGGTSVTKGPLGITISTREPVIIEGTDDTFKVFININLVGSGSVFDPDTTYSTPEDLKNEDFGKLKMKIEAPGASAVTGECSALNNYEKEELRRGQTLTYTCELKPESFATMTEIPITVTLYYGYLNDYSTMLKVVGTGEIQGP